MREIVDVLQGARDILAQGWWAQGNTVVVTPKGTSYCVLGAIAKACEPLDPYANGPRVFRQCVETVEDVLAGQDKKPGSIVRFNDAQGRTQQQVVALLDKAIERAKRT